MRFLLMPAVFSNNNPLGGNTKTINLVGQGNDQPVVNGGASLSVLFGPVVLNITKQATLTVKTQEWEY